MSTLIISWITLSEVISKLITDWVLQTWKCIFLAAQSLSNHWGKRYVLLATSLCYLWSLLFNADVCGERLLCSASSSSVTAHSSSQLHLVVIKAHRGRGHSPYSPVSHFPSMFSLLTPFGVIPMKAVQMFHGLAWFQAHLLGSNPKFLMQAGHLWPQWYRAGTCLGSPWP